MLTKEELEAIKERCEKATEGPWHTAVSSRFPHEDCIMFENKEVAEAYEYYDAEFIANARQDIPKLIAEIEALCPIGDLDIVSSLRSENDYLSHIVDVRDAEIDLLQSEISALRQTIRQREARG
ncbi:hypothetical protein [Oceanobacillus neutriphilus]|uniref:Ead/Ea22-like family protein n=1 Tax=Oceanobacillus neutriphilus TaxID=531815 RepID=A0ABQ2NYI0_9BACI|nr:hypothetical protein [Oceanobacillus neutriphilus]GGP13446.1 hypothetical protein GCM10011346_33470 [Oceanobacillus neutriphilus]